MKLVVIGLGQCGGRVADAFSRLNRKARNQRGITIVTDAFAVNTDVADLSGLTAITPNYQHRILIGNRKTGGHVIDLLFGLQRRREATLILVTHDERLAAACERTIRMADGRIESEAEAMAS